MENKIEKIIMSAMGVLMIIITISLLSLNAKVANINQGKKLGAGSYSAHLTATSSAITVGTSSTLVQASTTRTHCDFVNDGAYNIYLSFNNDAAAVLHSSRRLNSSGGSYTLIGSEDNLYYGGIRAIADGGASVLTVECN